MRTPVSKYPIGILIEAATDRKLLAGYLEQSGYSVQALAPSEFHPEGWREVSLVIADQAGAQHHTAALQELQRLAQPLLVPLLVLLNSHADGARWLAAGFDDVLRMPVAKSELEARLGVFLRLRETSETQYRALFENAVIGLYRAAPDGRLLLANQAFVRLMGKNSLDEMAGRTLNELGYHTMPPRWVFHERVEQEGQVVGLESAWVLPDGTRLDVRESAHAIHNQARLQAIEGTLEDISAQKQAEAALAASEQRFRALVEHASNVVAMLDEHGDYVYASPAMTRLSGYTPEELVGSNGFARVHPDDQAAVAELFADLLRQPDASVRAEMRMQNKTGDWRWLESEATNLLDVPGVAAIVVNNRDVTEHKLAAELRSHLAAIVASTDDAILGLTLDGAILSWNAGAERLYGYSGAEMVGRSIALLFPPERSGVFSQFVERLLRGDEHMEQFETVGLAKDGQRREVSVTISPMHDAAGRITGVATIARDMTERKRVAQALQAKSEELAAMTQQLWQAAKLATLGELAASIAHELNNPLAIMALRVETLLQAQPSGQNDRKSLEVIETEIERMAVLVSELLQFSRRQQQVSSVAIAAELRNTLEFIRHFLRNRHIDVQEEFDADLPLVHADRQQLRQVFLNLLTNAADAMADGGTLTVRARAGVVGEAAPAVLLEFDDTGAGIAPEHQARIWEPFFTTKPEGKGTGLGLPICRRIVQEHGGTIEIVSALGRGTTVRLALPTLGGRQTMRRTGDDDE